MTALLDNVVGATKAERNETLYCSFCGKSHREVVVLIAGPTVFICDGCTDLCAGLAATHRVRKAIREELGALGFQPTASGIEARSDETPQAAQPERQEPDPKGDAHPLPPSEEPLT